MKTEESHYYKIIDPSNNQTTYCCEHYNDISLIPKRQCRNGDLVFVKRGRLKYIFKNENWEMVQYK